MLYVPLGVRDYPLACFSAQMLMQEHFWHSQPRAQSLLDSLLRVGQARCGAFRSQGLWPSVHSQPRAQSLLDALLGARDEAGGAMGRRALRDELMTLLVAGQETAAIALGWACALLAHHPAAQVPKD